MAWTKWLKNRKNKKGLLLSHNSPKRQVVIYASRLFVREKLTMEIRPSFSKIAKNVTFLSYDYRTQAV